jgi:hypothetical protein
VTDRAVHADLTMFDSAFNDQYPPDPQAVAGYVDGHVGDQPNYDWLVSAFPRAGHLSITLDPARDAMCLDIEAGAASPESAAAWHQRQAARGVQRPCLYASASAMETAVLPVITAAGVRRADVRLWSAHYGAGAHICGPGSCGLLSVGADATQWTDRALGRNLDQSLLLPGFFGKPPAPPAPHPQPLTLEDIVSQVPVVKLNDSGQPVKNWQGLLRARGFDIGATGPARDGIDGEFGNATDSATRAFQSAHRLTADGEAGPLTLKAALGG